MGKSLACCNNCGRATKEMDKKVISLKRVSDDYDDIDKRQF